MIDDVVVERAAAASPHRLEYWQIWAFLTGGPHGTGLGAMRDRLERDRAEASATTARCERSGDVVGAVLGRVDTGLASLYLGDPRCAKDDLDRAVAAVEPAGPSWAGGYAMYGRGLLDLARNHGGAAATRFADAHRLFRSCGDERAQGYALCQWGRAAWVAGDHDTAQRRLAAASALFWQAEQFSGGRAAPASVLGVLTPREREVAELLATGLTNRRIAEQISVAERTVDTHVQRILAKLNCVSRVQVAVLVAESAGTDSVQSWAARHTA